MVVSAFTMVRQNLDDAALRDGAVSASLDHALELFPERGQAGDAHFHLAETGACDLVRGVAGLIRIILKDQQGPNCVDLEPELACVPNEGEPTEIGCAIEPSVAFGSGRGRQKPDLLVEPESWAPSRRWLSPLRRWKRPWTFRLLL